MIAPELRAWLDGLRHGHAVVVETSAGLHEGEVVERTASGRIRVRWSGGLDLFYGTDVELAGQRVGARASKAFARIRAAGPRLRPIHTADDLAAIALVAGTDPAALARALDRLPAETLARIADLASDLREALDSAHERNAPLAQAGSAAQAVGA